jgi:hypothetical protein
MIFEYIIYGLAALFLLFVVYTIVRFIIAYIGHR